VLRQPDFHRVTLTGEFNQQRRLNKFNLPESSAEVNPLKVNTPSIYVVAFIAIHIDWPEVPNVYRLGPRRGCEKEANAFAAHLLVPRHMLDQYYADLPASDLSKLFAVSVLTIKNRLEFEYGL
jgi:hypothetical protein